MWAFFFFFYFLVWGRPQTWGVILITSYQEYMLSIWLLTAGIGLGHPTALAFIRLIHWKLLLSPRPAPIPYCTLWNKITVHSPHLRIRGLCTPPWRGSFYMNYLEFFCMGDLPFSILYLCNPLCISIWIHVYLLYTMGHNKILLLKKCTLIAPALAIGSSFNCIWYPFGTNIACVCILSSFFISRHIRCSRLILQIH